VIVLVRKFGWVLSESDINVDFEPLFARVFLPVLLGTVAESKVRGERGGVELLCPPTQFDSQRKARKRGLTRPSNNSVNPQSPWPALITMSLPLNDSAGVSDRPAGSRGSEEHEALISDSLLAENHQFIGLTEEDVRRSIQREFHVHSC
jgi:hypothetical protein